MRLVDLADLVSGDCHGDATVTGITHDSRRVSPGDLYVAVPGFTQHGADFVVAAQAAGAVALATDVAGAQQAAAAGVTLPTLVIDDVRRAMPVLAARIFGNPERDLVICGVTGTNGKTTVTHMLSGILSTHGHRVAVIGTLSGARTTPESTDLFAELRRLRDSGVTHVVMEVSSHGLALHRVDGITFAVAGFTNLSQDHLDFHGSMPAYFAAKRRLFDACDAAVVNVDDEWGRQLADELAALGRPLVTVGTTGHYSVRNISQSLAEGLDFTLVAPQVSVPVHLATVGDFNAVNAAVAVAMATQLGVAVQQAAAALSTFQPVPGRLEPIPLQRGAAVVDYAHTPDAVERVLSVLSGAGARRIITVIGCGGDRDPSKREPMGRVAARRSDVVIVTDDNPRSENPAAIRAAVMSGAREGNAQLHEIADRREAIRYALSVAGDRDVVAVLGKGHETGQEVAGVVRPFDDRAVVRQEGAGA